MNKDLIELINIFSSRVSEINLLSAINFCENNEPEIGFDILLQSICEEDVAITVEEFDKIESLSMVAGINYKISENLKMALRKLIF